MKVSGKDKRSIPKHSTLKKIIKKSPPFIPLQTKCCTTKGCTCTTGHPPTQNVAPPLHCFRFSDAPLAANLLTDIFRACLSLAALSLLDLQYHHLKHLPARKQTPKICIKVSTKNVTQSRRKMNWSWNPTKQPNSDTDRKIQKPISKGPRHIFHRV